MPTGAKFFMYFDNTANPDGIGGSPVWDAFERVKDDDINRKRNTGETKDRGRIYVGEVPGLLTMAVPVNATYRRGDPAIAAIEAAFDSGEPLAVRFLDGANDEVGATGHEFDCLVKSDDLKRQLEDDVSLTFELVPHGDSVNEPARVTIATP